MATTKLLTAADLEHLEDDGYRYDLIAGELYRMAPANIEHGGLALELGRHLGNFVVPRRLGLVVGAETGFYLHRDPDTVLAPDVAFIRTESLPPPEMRHKGFSFLAPDLVAEIASPSETARPLERKAAVSLAAGVKLVWILHSQRQQVTIHRRGRVPAVLGLGETLDGEDVLPGFRLPLSDLFCVLP